MKFVKWIVILAVVIGVTAGVLRALKAREEKQARATEAAAALLVPPVFELAASDVYTVAPLTLSQTLPITGTVTAPQSATIKASVAGTVVDWRVREGETVKTGQVLGHIDAADLQARLHQAEQQAQAVKASVDTANRQFANNQALVAKGFISPTALQASKDSLAAAQANAAAAQANVSVARNALNDSVVRAPFDGQIAQRLVQQGDRVGVNAPLAQIVDSRNLELEVAISAAQLRQVAVGQTATLHADGLSQAITAHVTRINPNLSAGSRSATVYLGIPQRTGLNSGEFVRGELQVGQLNTLAVPSTAVHYEKPEPYIQVLQGGVVQHRNVQVEKEGQTANERWVTMTGLQAGEQVLRMTSGVLPAGTHAKVLNSTPAH